WLSTTLPQVWSTRCLLSAFFPHFILFILKQSVLRHLFIIETHWLWISTSVWKSSGLSSLVICLWHLTLHIKWADSSISILYSLLCPFIIFSSSFSWVIGVLSISPSVGFFHSPPFFVHRFLARSHTIFCPGAVI